MAALAIAGRTPSRPTNPRRSIDARFVSKIQVLVTWSARTIRGCPITVEGIANAKPSNAVIVLTIEVADAGERIARSVAEAAKQDSVRTGWKEAAETSLTSSFRGD